jgi:hypothetical protein
MSLREFTEEELQLISWGEFEEILEGAEIVEKGYFVSDHKWEHKEDFVFSYEGKFYSMDITRSGSYYTEYTYEYDQPYEVKQVEKTVIDWVSV